MPPEAKTFRAQTITLDGGRFENCVFERCTLDYGGGEPPVITGCSFTDCRFTFSGEAARTLAFLGAMHAGGFSSLVDATVEAVRARRYHALPAEAESPTPAPPEMHPLGLRVPRIVQRPKPR